MGPFRNFTITLQAESVKRTISKMVMFVQSHQTHVLDLAQHKTVKDVKSFMNDKEGLPTEQIAVFYEGQPLEDACELYNFKNETTLQVHLRLVGGKVHGSLARAGKVRGQTPKVDKQEKKKSKTGRAKRRQQYNRRFINVVETFGKKKGPNANS